VHCLAVPTPFAVGRVNCYLIEHGHAVEDLRRIVVTHQHIDHIGLVQILAERSGAEVCALDRLAPWLADYRRQMEENDRFSAEIMLRNGIPQDVVHALRAVSASFRAWGAAAYVTRPLAEGDSLQFASRGWRVLHRPGHSPSDTVFLDEDSGELFGGDHLIKHISSNPLLSRPLESLPAGAGKEYEREGMEPLGPVSPIGDTGDGQGEERSLAGEAPQRPKALMSYLDSLRKTHEMELSVVYAGHGEPIDDHRTLIDERFRMHERRAEKLYRLIAERPRNAYELAQEMWGNVAVTQAFLTLSEVLGHVDLLIETSRVAEREVDGVVRFEAV
jgi:glyoxylase-like metal-dependent hydrolase (beta-lactamase superfamily II)